MTPRFDHDGRDRALDVVVLLAVAALALALYLSLGGRYVLDCDVANLALGIERFDVTQHQPHPPGYLGYVMLLRAARALSGLSLLDVPRLVSRLFALATIGLTWLAARRLAPADRAGARWAALLAGTNPILLYYGVDGQTHSAEAAMAAALVWALADREAVTTTKRAIVVGLLLAAGGSFRPSYALVSVLPVLWAFGLSFRRLFFVALLGGLGTLAWLVPSAILTGGWHRYQLASDALVGNFIRLTSVLSSTKDPRTVALNLRDTLAWTILALWPAAACLLCNRLARARLGPETRRAGMLALTMALPAVAFYAVVLCAEAGYLAGLVPAAAVLGALACTGGPRWLKAVPALVAASQLAFFLFGPERIARTFMLPDANEVIERELRVRLLDEEIARGTADGDGILVVSDYGDPTALRQLAILHPRVEILFLHSKSRFALGQVSGISHATGHFWHWAPGEVLNADGDRKELVGDGGYDWIVLDPRSSPELRDQLAGETSCSIPPLDDRFLAAHLRPGCFPSSTIALEDFRFRFAAR